jgi:predicted RNA-binding Zn-ribbon protein involved in translation (DUF1610 family)
MPRRTGLSGNRPVPRCGRAFALLSGAALAVLVGSPGIASADDGRPQVNPEERAAAMIRPAVMYLAGQGYGQVRLPNGQILSQFGAGSNMPFIATWGCTGFVINPDGWVATAGHCVDPQSAEDLILKRAANEYINQFPDAPEARDPAATLEFLVPAQQSTATEPHFCANCGAEHHPAEKFCPNCGKQISHGESTWESGQTG